MNIKLLILWCALMLATTTAKITISDLKNMYHTYYQYPVRNLQQSGVTKAQSEAKRDEVCDFLADDVDVDGGEVVSEDDRKSWENNSESMRKTRDKNHLEPLFLDGEDADMGPFVTQIIKFAGVFAVFGGLSILSLILYLSCCICEGCCPPCKLCIKSCKQEKPYEGIAKYWSAVGVYLTSIMLFVVGIIGLVYVSGIEDSFHTFTCAGMITFHGASFGGGTFRGVNFLSEELTTYRDTHLDNLLTTAGQKFDGNLPDWTKREEEVLDRLTAAMVSEDCSSESAPNCQAGCQPVYQPGEDEPADFVIDSVTYKTKQACSGQSWDTSANSFTFINPSTGSPGVSPADSSKYFMDNIATANTESPWKIAVTEVKNKQQTIVAELKNLIQGLEDSGQGINDQSHTFRDGINDAIDAIDEFKKSSLDLMNDISTFHTDYKGIFGGITSSLTGFYGFFIALSIITSLLTTLIFFKSCFKLRLILHGVWCIQSIVMIFTFLCTVIFMVISLGGEQGCEVMHDALNDPKQYTRYSKKLDKDIRDKITICKRELNLVDGPYKGEDDIATAFDVDDELDSVRDLRDSLIKITDVQGDFSAQFEELKKVPQEIDQLTEKLEELENDQGMQSGTATSQNPNYDTVSLATAFNDFKGAVSGCDGDEVVGYGAECDTLVTFDQNAGSAICYKLSDDLTGFGTRYASCPTGVNFLTNIIAWRDEKNDLVQLKKLQTTAYKNQLNYYIASNENYIIETKAINDNIVAGLNFIAHEDTGILQKIRCFWFGEQLDNIYDSLCVKFVNSCYNFAFVLGWFSFSLFFGVFFIYMSVRRMGVNQKYQNEGVQVQPAKADSGYEPAKPQEEPQTAGGF